MIDKKFEQYLKDRETYDALTAGMEGNKEVILSVIFDRIRGKMKKVRGSMLAEELALNEDPVTPNTVVIPPVAYKLDEPKMTIENYPKGYEIFDKLSDMEDEVLQFQGYAFQNAETAESFFAAFQVFYDGFRFLVYGVNGEGAAVEIVLTDKKQKEIKVGDWETARFSSEAIEKDGGEVSELMKKWLSSITVEDIFEKLEATLEG